MLFLIIKKGNPQIYNINNVIRDQLQGKHITKFTKLYIKVNESLYHQNTDHCCSDWGQFGVSLIKEQDSRGYSNKIKDAFKKICFNDDALIAILPKVVCFVKIFFSAVYVTIILCQLIRKKVSVPFI